MRDFDRHISIAEEKALLRKELIDRIKAFPNKREESEKICSIILKEDEIISQPVILAFNPLRTEPDINRILRLENVATPFVENERMYFSFSRHFSKGELGFMEPEHQKAEFERAAILVPLLGFDRSKRRLGRGKGYYDRFIRDNRDRLLTIGVAFSVSEIDRIPAEEHDVILDRIVCGEFILK